MQFDTFDHVVGPTPTLHTSSFVNLEVQLVRQVSRRALEALRIPLGPFAREAGNAWVAFLPETPLESDGPKDGERSSLVVLEDGRPLGPPHTPHEIIRRVGKGMYSHWEGALIFSTSDNTDPNTNGREYLAIVPC